MLNRTTCLKDPGILHGDDDISSISSALRGHSKRQIFRIVDVHIVPPTVNSDKKIHKIPHVIIIVFNTEKSFITFQEVCKF